MPAEAPHLSGRRQIPQLQRLVHAAGQGEAAIRRKRNRRKGSAKLGCNFRLIGDGSLPKENAGKRYPQKTLNCARPAPPYCKDCKAFTLNPIRSSHYLPSKVRLTGSAGGSV